MHVGFGMDRKDDMKKYDDLRDIMVKTGTASAQRRLLALTCAACLVFLQCFMLLPALDGYVYAKDSLPITGSTAEGFESSGSYSDGDNTVEGILDTLGLDTSKVDSVGCDAGELKMGDDIVKQDGDYYIDNGEVDPETQEPILTPVGTMYFQMKDDYTPVKKVTLDKIGDLKAGKSKTLKYDRDFHASGDSFFKKHFPEYIEATVTGDAGQEISPTTIKFTAGSVGSTIKVTIKERIKGKSSSTKSCNVVSKKLTVTPSSLTLNVGASSTVIVKDDSGTLTSGQVKYKSSNSKVATVNSGIIRGVKKGTATITVTSKAPTSKGLKATVKVTVKETTTTRYTTRAPYTFRPTTRSGGSVIGSTTGTGATGTTTATRPTETASTMAPSFQTITVKQVFLTPATPAEEEVQYDEYGNPIEDEGTDDQNSEEEWDEDGVGVPAAAGSAAVAAAACGVGAVGRVRRFRHDMGGSIAAAVTAAAGEGGKRKFPGFKKSGSADAAEDAAKEAADSAKDASQTAGSVGAEKDAEAKSKNPLKKFRRKS